MAGNFSLLLECLIMEGSMGVAALDVSQDQTAICVVSRERRILPEAKGTTCPDAISAWLSN